MVYNFRCMKRIDKFLLLCGIIIPFYYIGIDALCALQYEGYSYADQAISELSAIGSPTASLWNTFIILYNPLIFALGLGVLRTASLKKSLRITGYLLMAQAIIGYGWIFFPMSMRGNIGSANDLGHLIMSGLTVLMMTLVIAFGSGANGKKFRIYSVLTILTMMAGGGYTASQASRVVAQLPTPWMGIAERIGVFSPMIWMAVLAIVLLKKDDKFKQ